MSICPCCLRRHTVLCPHLQIVITAGSLAFLKVKELSTVVQNELLSFFILFPLALPKMRYGAKITYSRGPQGRNFGYVLDFEHDLTNLEKKL